VGISQEISNLTYMNEYLKKKKEKRKKKPYMNEEKTS
jgi:hypothetical protein